MNTVEFWTAISAIGILLSAGITAGTLLYIARQTRDTRRFTQAHILNDLRREFDQYADLFMKFRTGKGEAIINNLQTVNDCLDYFERLKTLLDSGALPLSLVDRAFGYPFFLLVNDRRVQDRVLYTYDYEFPEVFALHQQLAAYRERRHIPIPNAYDDLATRDAARYAASLKTYALMR